MFTNFKAAAALTGALTRNSIPALMRVKCGNRRNHTLHLCLRYRSMRLAGLKP